MTSNTFTATVTDTVTGQTGTGNATFTVNATGTPKLSTLTDPLTSFNASLWTQQSPTNLSYSSAGLDIIAASGAVYPNVKSATMYDLTGSYMFAKFTPPAGGSGVTSELVLDSVTAGTDIRWTYTESGATISAALFVGYTAQNPVTAAYNATNHAYLGISESGGTMTWWTSPDAKTWTAFTSVATPSYANDIQPVLSAEATATSSTTGAHFAGYNVMVSGGTAPGSGGPPPPTGNVTVNFSNTTQAVDPLGAGVVITEFGGNPVPVVSNTGGWNTTLKNLAPGHCRCSVAYYSGNPGYGAGGSSRTPGSATALINAVKGIGAIPLVSYNGDSSDNGGLTTANAAALVHYFNDNGGQNGGPIQYWSVGNEPEVSGPTPSYSTLIPAMVGASSGIVVGAPAAAFWDTSLIQSVVGISGLGGLSYHAYDGADSPGSDNGGGGFYETQQYFNQTGTLRGYQSGLIYGVEEFNWNAAPSSSETVTWQETAWIADVLGQLLSSGAHGTVYGDSNGPLSVISDGASGQPAFGTPMPAYWGIGIWTGMNGAFKRWSAHMVSCTTTFPNTSISAYACDNGKIVVVNKSTSSQSLTISMTGKTSGTYNVSVSVGNPPTGISKVVTNAAYTGSVITYTMPASSVASIDVT